MTSRSIHSRAVRLVIALAIAWSSAAAANPVTPLPDAVWRRDVLVGGDHHMCAIRGDRSVMCWGMNVYGEVGDATHTAHPVPIIVPGMSKVLALGASDSTTCAIDGDRHVWCWGGYAADKSAPHRIAGVDNAAELAVALTVACARRLDGEVRCWHTDGADPVPHEMGAFTRARRIIAGQMFVCAIDEDGRVPCLLYRTGKVPEVAPIEIAAARGATQLGATFQTLYAVRPDGSVIGFALDSDVPAIAQFPIAGVSDAVDLAVGLTETCIARRGGDVSCVGDGAHPLPALHAEPALRGASSFVTTGSTSCAVRADRKLVCWGDSYGAVGHYDRSGVQATPIELAGIGDAVELALEDEQTCVRRADHTVWCVGDPHDPPKRIAVPAKVERVFAGHGFACVTDAGGLTSCWGSVSWQTCRWESADNCQPVRIEQPVVRPGLLDVAGAIELADPCVRLGTGDVRCIVGDGINTLKVVAVPGKANAISARCFVDPRGAVACWTGDPLVPARVAGLGPATAVVNGRDHTCALLRDGAVSCWGANVLGQLGDGTRTARDRPAVVPGLVHVVELVAGEQFTCARTVGGEVWCWGANAGGALGDASGRDHASPVKLALHGVVELRASRQHACARLGDGHVACWGHTFGDELPETAASAAERVLDPDAIAP